MWARHPFLELRTKHTLKELKGAFVQLNPKDGPNDCGCQGSIPQSVTKHRHYIICQQDGAERARI